MGLLVVDEVFDSWEMKKTPLDFHLVFPQWHELTCARCCGATAIIPR